MRNAEVVYLEIREPAYWAGRRFATLLFPLVELALAALVALRPRPRPPQRRVPAPHRGAEEPRRARDRGEHLGPRDQESPAVDHGCRPAYSRRPIPQGAQREIGIINDEVERLSALSHRVGDYLRDPAGNPRPIDPADLALEVGMRLCGRNVLKVSRSSASAVSMDPERLRSVLENLVRNALESGGPEEGVSIEAGAVEGKAGIDVLDRGAGPRSRGRGQGLRSLLHDQEPGHGHRPLGLQALRRGGRAAPSRSIPGPAAAAGPGSSSPRRRNRHEDPRRRR